MFVRAITKLLAVCAATLIVDSAFAVFRYVFTDLGPVGLEHSAYSINNAGLIVCKTENTLLLSNPSPNYGFAYTSQNGFASFLLVPGDSSVGWQINSLGMIGGSWGDSNTGLRHGFLYQNSNYIPMDPISGATSSEVYGLNDLSLAVGHSDTLATVWNGGIAGPIPGTISPSAAWGVNNLGTIVGDTAAVGFDVNQPFLYDGAQLNLLSLPTTFTFTGGTATRINDLGHIVGTAYSDTRERAVLWVGGVPTDLGSIESEFNLSVGLGINNYDQVVGTCPSRKKYQETRGFLWQEGQMYDLNTLVNNLNQWRIAEARSINDYGQIVGIAARNDTDVHAFRLDPIPAMGSFTVDPLDVVGGVQNAAGTVTLTTRAIDPGAAVSFTSSPGTAASVPLTATIPTGSSSITIPITTHTVPVDQTVVVTANYAGVTISHVMMVRAVNAFLNGFNLSSNTVFEGQPVTGTVTLSKPAPAGGAVVTLTNSNPAAASVPTSTTIAAGTSSKSFPITTHAAPTAVATTIRAHFATVTLQQTLNVTPIALQSLDLTQYSLIGGAADRAVVRIPIAAPAGGYRVNLSTSNTQIATVPTTVTIPAGATSIAFTVTTRPVNGTSFVTIIANHSASTMTRQLQVLPPEISSFHLSASSVRGGNAVTGTVTLNGRAPTGGSVVHLESYPGLVSTSGTVTVPAGATSLSFRINTSPVSGNTSVRITVWTYNTVQSANLTLTHL